MLTYLPRQSPPSLTVDIPNRFWCALLPEYVCTKPTVLFCDRIRSVDSAFSWYTPTGYDKQVCISSLLAPRSDPNQLEQISTYSDKEKGQIRWYAISVKPKEGPELYATRSTAKGTEGTIVLKETTADKCDIVRETTCLS